MTDAHCHIGGGDPKVREFIVGRDFFGVHPWKCLETDFGGTEDLMTWLRGELAAHPQAGVGEIGLDRLKEREIPPAMRTVFERQLEVALECARPVVLHGAKCWGQVVKAVREGVENRCRCRKEIDTHSTSTPRPYTFLFHGFSRSDGLIPDIVALNGYISVGPAVLNDHAVNYRELVKKIPAERLLVETDRDCPVEELVSPHTREPLTIREILTATAAIRGVAVDELERVTDENAVRCFGHDLV